MVVFAVAAVLAALVSAAAVDATTVQCPGTGCPSPYPGGGGNGSGSGAGNGAGTTAGGQSGAVPAVPLVSLDPITIVNGIASVTGTVHAEVSAGATAGAAAALGVQVAVNGNPVSISAGGTFTASTNVAANGGITVQAGELSAGISYSISIPAAAIPANGVDADALVQLKSDGITLMLPPDGFTIVDGVGVDASVHVAGIDGIVRLSLNGTNLLSQLRGGSTTSSSSGATGSSKPGAKKIAGKPAPVRHTAVAHVSGKAKSVNLTVTAKNGATQTTAVTVQRISSVVRIGRLLSVSAFGARGIRIAKIAFDRRALRSNGRLGVAVTVVDRRHYLVRDAVVMLQPFAHHTTIQSSWARMSNTLGRATFSVPVTSRLLGHRLYLRVVAQTPRSQTHLTASTMLVGCGC